MKHIQIASNLAAPPKTFDQTVYRQAYWNEAAALRADLAINDLKNSDPFQRRRSDREQSEAIRNQFRGTVHQ